MNPQMIPPTPIPPVPNSASTFLYSRQDPLFHAFPSGPRLLPNPQNQIQAARFHAAPICTQGEDSAEDAMSVHLLPKMGPLCSSEHRVMSSRSRLRRLMGAGIPEAPRLG
jgi:hypothetical protein